MDLLQRFKKERGNQKAEIPELPQMESIEPESKQEIQRNDSQEHKHTGTEADIQEPEPSEITSTNIPETPPAPIAAAPTVQEPDQREKELDELLDQLKPLNRHWKIEWAREKKVPMKALLHAANLWLSDDTDDWTAANDTMFQFTSQFGNKQLCYRRSDKVAIPDITHK